MSAVWWRQWLDFVNYENSFDASLSECEMYEKPGLIINRGLLDGVNLVPGLQEKFDYVAVCLEVWMHLNAWYGSDYKVCRRMIKDVSSEDKWRLELYPERHYSYKAFGRPPSLQTLPTLFDERRQTETSAPGTQSLELM